jgi:ribonuclease D
MTEFTLVEHMDNIATDLGDYEKLGVDTEFMREKTYFAQLCLVQLATPGGVWCVDPIAGESLDDFWALICSRTWIVHSARQDIEVIFQTSTRMPAALFDTQVAAGLLGIQPQIGYAGLVNELFSVEIPKSHTRADWTRRPLPAELLHYAVEDVEYLLPACELLSERLDKVGRLAWAEQDSALLLDESLYTTDVSQAIDRLKGARNLRGRQRAAAAGLARWREEEALRLDRPRQWILRDRALLDMATKMPTSIKALQRIDNLPGKLLQRAGDRLIRIIAKAGNDRDYRPPSAPSETQKRMLKSMQEIVAECADDLALSAEIIAPRKELAAVVLSGKTDSRVFTNWRRELVGEKLLALL